MRTITFLFACILTSTYSIAQDDIPDYRSKRENFSKMPEKDIQADLATFTLAGLDQATGKEPLPYVPAINFDDKHIQLQKDKIDVNIYTGKFDPSKHKILYYDEKYVTKIDNKPYFAVLGQMPKKTIDSISVVWGRDTIVIPKAAYADLYEPVFCKPAVNGNTKCNTGVYLSKDGSRMYIYMLNSDGYKGYEVTWVIQDKKYLRRVVDWDF